MNMQSRKKTVVHLVYSFSVGGLETIVANFMHDTKDTYNHVIVTLNGYSSEFIDSLNVEFEIYDIAKKPGHDLASFLRAWRIIKRVKPDIVHSYNLAAFEYQVVAWLLRVKKRVHAEHGRDVNDPDGSNVKYQYLRKILTMFVHKVFAVSDDLYRWLIKTVKLPIYKVELVLNGVDTNKFLPSEAHKLASDSETPNNYFVFGHVARLQGIKNQKNLITAFIKASEDDDSFKKNTMLSIVGDGPLRKELESLADGNHQISFNGTRHDMDKVYKEFSCFVLSSDAEGIPMTMLEAMSSGLPVLSTRVGGIPEVTTNDFSILVDKQDANKLAAGMLQMFKRRTEIKNMGMTAREHVINCYSQSAMVKSYTQGYEN